MALETLRPAQLADWLIGRGQHFITTDDAAALLGVKPSKVRNSLRRPREAGEMLSVTKGGWVPVPAEHRSTGAPPAANFVDPMMRHLGHPYYVGLLSAADIHGSAHQAPQTFQIVTPALLRDRTIGRNHLRFIRRRNTVDHATTVHTVATGRLVISTPETTLLDLAEAPLQGGGLSNIATVTAELLEDHKINPEALTIEASKYAPTIGRRLAYLIELVSADTGYTVDLSELRANLDFTSPPTPLSIHHDPNGELDTRWNLIINTEIEPDL